MTLLVIDASAAIRLAAMPAVDVLAGYECVAPPLMWSEATSALVEANYRGEVPDDALDEALDRLESLPISVTGMGPEDRRRAVRIARSLGWAKTYDAEYVAVARHLECRLLSTDLRLIRGAQRLVTFIQPSDLTAG